MKRTDRGNGEQVRDPEGRVVGGRYRLGSVIGIGSSAVVRRARDLAGGAPVAVKMFHAGGTVDDRRQRRREVDALSRMHHPGLVGLHADGLEDGAPYVVTDLVEGPTLAEQIRIAPLPPEQVRRLAAELADALAHVHAGGIVHRDVKPANVLLGDGSRARLADFGIAKAVDGAVATEAGMVVGTAAFLAPEQARGAEVGPPADMYALGLVLLEALTGRREYPGRAAESATARLHRNPAVPDGLPGGLTGLIRALTSVDPAMRPTAAEVAALLGPPAPAPRRAGAHRRRSRRGPVPVAVSALGIAAAGAAAVMIGYLGTAGPAPAVDPATPSAVPVGR
jgi:serine/threonine protein kinase